MQITRYASLSEPQFLGCVSAFADTLTGELNSAAMYLRKLDGQAKGAAFAYEMSLDRHRYGALTVLDRWGAFVAAFGPHMTLSRYPGIVSEAPVRVRAAEGILERANELIDAAAGYSSDVVEACVLAFQSLGPLRSPRSVRPPASPRNWVPYCRTNSSRRAASSCRISRRANIEV